MDDPRLILGLALSSAHVDAAIIDSAGKILVRAQLRLPDYDTMAGLLPLWIEYATALGKPLAAKYAPLAVGVAAEGHYHPQTGVLRGGLSSDPALKNYPLKEKLSAALHLPVFIENAFKAVTLAELHYGAGKGCQHVIAVNMDADISGAIILNGRLYHGSNGLAGQAGQLITFDSGVWLEEVSSGEALVFEAESSGLIEEGATEEAVFERARAGSRTARKLVRDAGEQVGRALAGLTHLLDPERLLIGGVVGLQPETLKAVNQGLKECLLPAHKHLRAEPMQLGVDARLLGAAVQVFANHSA
ncbi:MAG: ROK family protein [bacterium]|nr:ROK family protein [bacterium]